MWPEIFKCGSSNLCFLSVWMSNHSTLTPGPFCLKFWMGNHGLFYSPPLTKLSVRTAVICSTFAEEKEGFSEVWVHGFELLSRENFRQSWVPNKRPINVKTAEPIRPKFFVGHHVTPGKVYEWSKLKKFVFKSFLFL